MTTNCSIPDWIKLSGLSLLLLLGACQSTETVLEDTPETRPGDIDYHELLRPIPYPIDIPFNYQYAVEQGTRSAEGAPGEHYWQNESRYHLKAHLSPEENRVNGSARIIYKNNSPANMEQMVLELAQNLHKAGTMKKEQTEITGGMELTRVSIAGEELEPIREDNPD